MRVGTGFDAHRFECGRRLVLGGVEIPSDMGLSGHSDADVVLHALMDALLGACAAGDIGTFFPDTEPAYLGASSVSLLREVMEVVRGKGYCVHNIDVTVVCEEPRILPYRDRMRGVIATACGVPPGSVSVKGTTTEGMGFTGRREGVMALATVLLNREGIYK